VVGLDVFFPIFSDGSWFCEADGANFGVGENDCGDVFVREVVL
jgi:hypothetical protein